MKPINEQTVGEIVAEDYRTAQIFKNHKIDFCCNGGRSLEEVAKEKKLNAKSLWEEIDKVKSVKAEGGQDFESWPLDLLADYIVKTHHRYSERQIQTLKPYLDKICQ